MGSEETGKSAGDSRGRPGMRGEKRAARRGSKEGGAVSYGERCSRSKGEGKPPFHAPAYSAIPRDILQDRNLGKDDCNTALTAARPGAYFVAMISLIIAGGISAAAASSTQFAWPDMMNHTLLGEQIPAREVVCRNRWGTPMLPDGKGGYSLIAKINPDFIKESLIIPPGSPDDMVAFRPLPPMTEAATEQPAAPQAPAVPTSPTVPAAPTVPNAPAAPMPAPAPAA